jgi:hypothetical protein
MSALAGHDAAYTHVVWVVASLIGISLLAALGVLYRRARAAQEIEDAERIIADAYRFED